MAKALDHICSLNPNNPHVTTILAGDFNVGDINWEDAVVESGSSQRDLC